MTPEQYSKAIEIEREFQSNGKERQHLNEFSGNLFLQAEAYGCGGEVEEIAGTTAESVKIFLELHPERIMEVCQVLMEWADAESTKLRKHVDELKERVAAL